MKNLILELAVVGTLLSLIPPVHALNCDLGTGGYGILCNTVNNLSVDESYKEALMNPSLYGQIKAQVPTNLEIPKQEEGKTLESIYNEKIVFIVKLISLVFLFYFIFSIFTKSSFLRKWLTADY